MSGPVDHKDYIIETVGCGCAFIDYDNDGWMDVLVRAALARRALQKAQAIACTATTGTAHSPM